MAITKESYRIIFGLGSNLGNRAKNLELAKSLMLKKLELEAEKTSNILENKALLKPNSPKEWDIDFFNIAISANINITKFPPHKILEIIKNIESEIGRKPTEIWAPREIDIDILAIEDLIISDQEKLIIPHKAVLERDFFIKTMSEIEPDWQYPVTGENHQKKISEFLK